MAGMKYKDIAAKYNVSIATVKSWKTRYKWNRKSMHTKNEKVCIQNQSKKNDKNEPIVDEVNDVLENADLTEKQRLFCVFFIKCFNATKAYQKAYKCSYETAVVAGPRLLGNVRVKETINQLKKERLNREYLSKDDIFQKYMDIAFADIGDYLQFGPKGIRLNDSADVDTSIIAEVSEGRNGIKLKLADRMKALEWLSEHMDMANSSQKEEYASKKDNIADILKQLKELDDEDVGN